jgi:hypothetical protein
VSGSRIAGSDLDFLRRPPGGFTATVGELVGRGAVNSRLEIRDLTPAGKCAHRRGTCRTESLTPIAESE